MIHIVLNFKWIKQITKNLKKVKSKIKILAPLEQKEIISELEDNLQASIILDKLNKQSIVNIYEEEKECVR